MAIVVGDRRYVTLSDDLYVNGTKVLEAYADGVKVYPEKGVELEGNPYVVKYCGSASFAFNPLNYCKVTIHGGSGGPAFLKAWFTLSVSYSVVVAIYADNASPAVLGDIATHELSEEMMNRKIVLRDNASKTMVLDMMVNLYSTNWSVNSPVGQMGIGEYGIYWLTPAGFVSGFSGVHRGGIVENLTNTSVMLALSGKDLAMPDKLVMSSALSDADVAEALRNNPGIRDYLVQDVSAEDLFVEFRHEGNNYTSGRSYISGVEFRMSEMIHLFNWDRVVWDFFGGGSRVYSTNYFSIPITDILYCGLASDLKGKYDFKTSVNDFKKNG